MTYDELWDLMYFGMRLYVEGKLVSTADILYLPQEDSINAKPRTISHTTEDGETISFTVECLVETDDTGYVFRRNCRVETTEGKKHVEFRCCLNQVAVRDRIEGSETESYDHGIEIDGATKSRFRAVKKDTSVEIDMTPDLTTLWDSCSSIYGSRAYNFGGLVSVYVSSFEDNLEYGDGGKLVCTDDGSALMYNGFATSE